MRASRKEMADQAAHLAMGAAGAALLDYVIATPLVAAGIVLLIALGREFTQNGLRIGPGSALDMAFWAAGAGGYLLWRLT